MSSYRCMRVIVFFDLPTLTNKEKRAYRAFRRYLLHEGFIMMQYSVYVKFALHPAVVTCIIAALKAEAKAWCDATGRSDGDIKVMALTEAQYAKMEYIMGSDDEDINGDDRYIEI